MATIELQGIHKTYNEVEVIRGIDLTIHDQELTVFVGPSGCGKSTLLRLIAGLEDISAGDLLLDGERINLVSPSKRGLALVFQGYALYPHMTVFDNMAFCLKLAQVSKSDRKLKVLNAARILNLEELLDRKPKDLSGGQRQRVAIGRAIVRDPKVFLFDEPLSNLDAALRVRMRLELTKLHRQLRATMIYVTHDQVEAMTMADRMVVMQAGRIEQVGTPMELYRTPKNLFVAGFIGSPKMNFLQATVTDTSSTGTMLRLQNGCSYIIPAVGEGIQPGTRASVGVRPEHISLRTTGTIQGKVQMVETLGAESYVHVVSEKDEVLTVRLTGDTSVRTDDTIWLALDLDQMHVFDAGGNAFTRVVT